MSRKMTAGLLLSAIVMVAQMGVSPAALGQSAKGLRVVSEQTATVFAFPESVAYDPKANRPAPAIQGVDAGHHGTDSRPVGTGNRFVYHAGNRHDAQYALCQSGRVSQ